MPEPVIDDLVFVLSQRLDGATVAISMLDGAQRQLVASCGGPSGGADGDIAIDLLRTAVPIHADDGTSIGIVETSVDVPPGSAAWHTLVVGAGLAAAAFDASHRRRGRRAPVGGMVVVATDGLLRAVSPTVATMIDRTPAELVGLPVFDLVHPDDHAAAVESLGRTAAFPGEKFPLDLRFLRADGSSCLLEVTATYRDDPLVEDLVFIVCEPSTRHDADAFVAEQSQVLASIGRGAPLGHSLLLITELLERYLGRPAAALLDGAGVLRVHASSGIPALALDALDGAVLEAAGITPAVVVHRGQADRCSDLGADPAWRHRPGADALIDQGLIACWAVPIASSSAGRPMGAIAMFDRDGTPPLPEEVRLADLCAGLASVAVERSRAEAALARQATHDALTGLPNRAHFLIHLAEALRSRRGDGSVAVMFLDLDRFKVINDALGHATGDELLVAIADRLRRAAGATATIARFGGDEFTVLCEDVTRPDDAMAIARRFIDALREPLPLAGTEVLMTASVGVALADAGTVDAGALLRDADAAMYRAKDRGRNRVALFDDELRALAVARLDLEHQLAEAVERGDFALVYQPEYELRTGRVVGTEALLRWRHPVRGELRPADFITIAEETGAIAQLGDWVFEQACRQAIVYLAVTEPGVLDPSYTMWVNVSVVQLLAADFPERVERALLATGVSPTRMGIEITESALIGDSTAAISALTALKALGVGIAIDDFGTGYSSLSYLAQLPADLVKIDGSFVERIGVDERGTAVVGGITRLAHAVGCRVVAEGVETMHQLSALLPLGCDDAQGFVLALPQPASVPLREATLPAG